MERIHITINGSSNGLLRSAVITLTVTRNLVPEHYSLHSGVFGRRIFLPFNGHWRVKAVISACIRSGAQYQLWRLVQSEPIFLDALHYAHDFFRISGLNQVGISSQVIRGVDGAGCLINGENYDWNSANIRLRSFPLQQLKAGHLRQIKIKKNESRQRVLTRSPYCPSPLRYARASCPFLTQTIGFKTFVLSKPRRIKAASDGVSSTSKIVGKTGSAIRFLRMNICPNTQTLGPWFSSTQYARNVDISCSSSELLLGFTR